MSSTLDRISKEQQTQAFYPLTDASFVAGKLQLGEHVLCVNGTLAEEATYELRLAPAGIAEGCMCSILVNVGEDATLSVKSDVETLFSEVTDGSIFAVLFCDGLSWRVIWDRNAAITLSSRTPVPNGGTEDQLLAKASTTDGDVEWQTIPKIPAGGTTGQVLAKKSDADFDLEWVAP